MPIFDVGLFLLAGYLVVLSLLNIAVTLRPDAWPPSLETTVDRLMFFLRRSGRDQESYRQARRKHPGQFIVGSVVGLLVGIVVMVQTTILR